MNYGVIGNCLSAALVSKNGSMEWLCLPDFSSSSVFAKILDKNKGGSFEVQVPEGTAISQQYMGHTNILLTRFEGPDGSFDIIDFMPRYKDDRGDYVHPPDVIRYVRHLSGRPKARFIYRPALMYGEGKTVTFREESCIKSYTEKTRYESVYLYTDFPNEDICKSREVTIDKEGYFLISYNQKLQDLNIDKIILEFERTKNYWLNWVDRMESFDKYNEEIVRSALVLKLLSYQPSGALIASVTTSLPEVIGEERNWDYRFCWIRDASMMISVMVKLGHSNFAERFVKFLLNVVPYKHEKIQIMYGINGEKKLTEKELSWLDGFEGTRPVRIGNAAYKQKQNDIYGVLLDVIYEYFSFFHKEPESSESEYVWTITRTLVRTVIDDWRKSDKGIWEYRSMKAHFVFSKTLCWVALDRGVKIAELLGKENYVKTWSKTRDLIKADILQKGWSDEKKAFTQSYESDNLDASNLLMATYGFINPDDPKFVSTVLETRRELSRDGLMYRYRNKDDYGEQSSAFIVCSFWLVKSLYMIGEKDEARRLFDELLTYSNHLGLYSEDLDFDSKRLLGNFPQGYSHLALIDAAMTLSAEDVDE